LEKNKHIIKQEQRQICRCSCFIARVRELKNDKSMESLLKN